MTRREDHGTDVLARTFGPLEVQVLDAVWREGRPSTVRDLHGAFPGFAYTTLMTTLDRLHKKGVLLRTKVGRAFQYEPRHTRSELELRLAARSIQEFLVAARGTRGIEPLLSCFVEAVSERDRVLLDDLERLLKAKRTQIDRGEP